MGSAATPRGLAVGMPRWAVGAATVLAGFWAAGASARAQDSLIMQELQRREQELSLQLREQRRRGDIREDERRDLVRREDLRHEEARELDRRRLIEAEERRALDRRR